MFYKSARDGINPPTTRASEFVMSSTLSDSKAAPSGFATHPLLLDLALGSASNVGNILETIFISRSLGICANSRERAIAVPDNDNHEGC